MKFNKIILPSIALATIMASCDDQIMEWQDKDGSVDASELPLKDSEKLLLYKPIKEYVAQYHPNLNLALGVGADLYLNDPEAKSIIDANFTGITLGNAMKMGVIMNASGNIDFTTVDNVLAAMPAGKKLYGHNLLWHTQQPQTYLKSLIAPKMEVVGDQQDVCINIISNSDFEDGTDKGWTGFWG
ncbi:MAG: endo-1,4-beta-xylanase, partial [Muribaculum sp.]